MKKNDKIDWIVFDCFGVILSEIANKWLYSRFSPEQAVKVNTSLIRAGDLGYLTGDEVFAALSRLTGEPQKDVERAWTYEPARMEDTIALIRELKKSYRTALLSNAIGGIVEKNLGEELLSELFDVRVISNRVGMAKPDAEIFLKTIDALGCPAGRAVFIDDTPANMAAAERCGMRGIVFTGAASLAQSIEKL